MRELALDICIQLTAPPQDAPADVIADIALHCEMSGLSCTVGLLADPLTESERQDLQWYLEEYWLWPYEGFAQRAKDIESLLAAVGQRLYNVVFRSTEARKLLASGIAQDGQSQICIVSDIPAALSLPWELLHDGQQFLCVSTQHSVAIVRRLPLSKQGDHQTTFVPPLRILLITAQPEGMGFVDPRGIASELYDALQAQNDSGTIELEFLRPPTLAALRKRLKSRRHPVHVLHFDGHGIFDRETMQQGVLAFEDEDGHLDVVEARALAQVLQDSGVRFVVLTACQSAVISREDSLSSVAVQLVQCGVDAVVAMNASVLVASTTRYTQALYHALATGMSVSMAHEQALLALHRDPNRHLQRRPHDERGTPVRLYDWWVPQLYLQQAISLLPDRPVRRRKKPKDPPISLRWNEDMPGEPRYGFSGRARELLRLERWLLQGKIIIISGFGGTGKTILAREAADWFTRTRMYDGACFVSFEHGGDAAMLLSMLGHYLGIYDGQYHPDDSTSALLQLGKVLKKKRILLIADNLESILPGGEAPLEAGLCTQLWDVLLELTRLGTGVLLTSRDTGFDDERLSPSSQSVRHLLLRGLRPTDAFMLATNLFADLNIDSAHVPYPELRDLLALLDHHPLAIQLVLPVLRELPVTIIRSDFATLLPRFVDNAETGHNRSLLASLEYSLRRLSESQREALPCLAIFQGGVSEDNLLAITQIPEEQWLELRQAMEQAALLKVERIHKDISVPFLQFHPVLTPFLRQGPHFEIEASLFGRYLQRYYDLARFLYTEYKHHPQLIRIQVRRELPNLIQTLHLLLQEDLEAASNMSTCIADFLDRFGLWRQRDDIRRSVAAVSSKEQEPSILTQQEWLYESGCGDDEYQNSNFSAALARFKVLLARVEAIPEGDQLGRNSYTHCTTLHRLARCFKMSEQLDAAEEKIREALAILDILSKKEPESRLFIRQRSLLLSELGDVACIQGHFEQARFAYNAAFSLVKQIGDRHAQAVILGEMGILDQEQRLYTDAKAHLSEARNVFHSLKELANEADVWYQLGRVAEEQQMLEEAERCYRQSLTLDEQRGDMAAVVKACNQLALVAQLAERPVVAESWYKRALEIEDRTHSSIHTYATLLNNLANLLLNQVWVGKASSSRLVEAREYAEQALSLDGGTSESTAVWTTLYVLSMVALLEGEMEKSKEYRRREREAFAAFAGNRYHIDQQCGYLIAGIAMAVENPELQAEIESVLPSLEARGWRITTAIQRIWAGERDWHILAEDLDRQEALLLLRVLETLTTFTDTEYIEEQGKD